MFRVCFLFVLIDFITERESDINPFKSRDKVQAMVKF